MDDAHAVDGPWAAIQLVGAGVSIGLKFVRVVSAAAEPALDDFTWFDGESRHHG